MAALMVMVAMVVTTAMMVEGQGSEGLPPMDFCQCVKMDPGHKYHMKWKPRDNDIVFEVQVATRGWVGLGFSPSGGMQGADIVLGWVDEGGQPILHDRYSRSYAVPTMDESQDVTLLGGYENDTHTVLRFSRPWTTSDTENDMQLTTSTIPVIWAYQNEDPTSLTEMRKHDHDGARRLNLKNPRC